MNFLAETIKAIEGSGHKVDDILHIGNDEYECSWDEFLELANIEYDKGFGAAEVATDLRIIFTDGSNMHRGEYDGSEWWEYSRPFILEDKVYKKITKLVKPNGFWPNLEKLNGENSGI